MKKGLRDFIIRSGIFLVAVYVLLPLMLKVISPVFGSNDLIETNMYASIVAVLVLGAFVVLRHKEIASMKQYAQGWESIVYIFIAAVAFVLFVYTRYSQGVVDMLGSEGLVITLNYLFYFGAIIFLAVGIYTVRFFNRFIDEIITVIVVVAGYLATIALLDMNWRLFGYGITYLNAKVLSIFGEVSVLYGQEFSLGLDKFVVNIGLPCSGIMSLLMFLALFIVFCFFDYERLRKEKVLKYLLIGLGIMFLIAVLRVMILMVIGAYWSSDLALSLFHNNVGWVLFIIYVCAYWYVVYPRLFKKESFKNRNKL
ncbi:exosortase/archaeosortase family protein [Candidatus Woesearchaeota archaeon]|nr:exosortase/archaeosortase family protein [Candidatus Woesearchaeota archaeon]MBW3021660.1 exosortase/archaeosortase family protein [Candidatus Woesearchaeota archaeon]